MVAQGEEDLEMERVWLGGLVAEEAPAGGQEVEAEQAQSEEAMAQAWWLALHV